MYLLVVEQYINNISDIIRKPALFLYKQQTCISAQSDQHLCCSQPGLYSIPMPLVSIAEISDL